MTKQDALRQAKNYSTTHGIYYEGRNPSQVEICPHDSEKEGYLIWCDCTVAARKLASYPDESDVAVFYAMDEIDNF